MSGAGLTDVEKFVALVQDVCAQVERSRAGNLAEGSVSSTAAVAAAGCNARARALARLRQALPGARRLGGPGEGGQDVAAELARALFSCGERLRRAGELQGAMELGFLASTEFFERLRDDAEAKTKQQEAKLNATRCVVALLEAEYQFGRGSVLVRSARCKVDVLVQTGLRLTQEVQEHVCAIKDPTQQELLYWLVLNATVLCLALCEPLAAQGLAHGSQQYLSLSILAMETVLPLGVVKYLPWRVRLYQTLACVLEQEGRTAAAERVIKRLQDQIDSLRRDESQELPIPEDVLQKLDTADALADTLLVKLHLRKSATGHAEELSQLFEKLQGPQAQLAAIATLMQVPGSRPLVRTGSTVSANFLSVASASSEQGQALDLLRPVGDQLEQVLESLPNDADLDVAIVLTIVRALIREELWSACACALRSVSGARFEKATESQRCCIEICRALYMLQCEGAKAQDLESRRPEEDQGSETLSSKVVGENEVAQVEGKFVRVNPIRLLSQALSRGRAQLCKSDPDLLIDAAIFLFSPFCAAMLETIGSAEVWKPVNPSLLEVSLEALIAVHQVFTACDHQDYVLRGTVAIRTAHLLHSTQLRDSRQALALLRSALRVIRAHRDEQTRADESLRASSFSLERQASFGKADAGKEVLTLATLEVEACALLFQIEFANDAWNSVVSARTSRMRVSRLSKKGNNMTLTIANAQQQTKRRKALEQRLAAEFKRNRYAKALCLVTAAGQLADSDFAERLANFKAADQLLQEAAKEEQALLAQYNENATAPSTGERVSPRILRRSADEIVLQIRPWSFAASSRQPSYYMVFGKSAGSGTDVSLTNCDLTGTGVPIPVSADPEGMTVVIKDLVPNESYIFAVAAFNESGRVMAGGIGQSTVEVTALSALSILHCRAVVSKLSFASMRHILVDDPLAISLLHHSVRDQVRQCKMFCMAACEAVIKRFVHQEPHIALWESNPMEDLGLRAEEVKHAPQAELQGFIHAVILLNKLEGKREPAIQFPRTLEALTAMDFRSVAFKDQLERLYSGQLLNLALHVSVMLNDTVLLPEVACLAFQQLVGLLPLARVEPRITQTLVSIQKALWQIPRESWNDAVTKTYASCCYYLLQLADQRNESKFGRRMFLGDVDAFEEDGKNARLTEEGQDSATELQVRDCRERSLIELNFKDQHALATKLRLAYGGMMQDNCDRLLEAIHQVVGFTHDFASRPSSGHESLVEEIEGEKIEADPRQIGFDEQVLCLLSRAARSSNIKEKEATLKKAWAVLQDDKPEMAPEYLRLTCLVCRESLRVQACPSGEWAEDVQHALLDFSPQAPSFPTPTVSDVLLEEEEEHGDSIESLLAQQYPATPQRDPIGLVEKDGLEARLAELDTLDQANASQANAQDGDEGDQDETPGQGNEKEQSEEAVVEKELATEAAVGRQLEKERIWSRLNVLRRRLRLLEKRLEPPDERTRMQLLGLAELELIRATDLFKGLLSFPRQDHVKARVTPADEIDGRDVLVDGILDEGPCSDLKWQVRAEEEAASSPSRGMVPPLKPLGDISEGANIDEDGEGDFADSAGLSQADASAKLRLDKLSDTLRSSSPKLLHLCARAMVRARWGHSWKQLQQAGKMLWNVLQFSWISPAQFADDVVCQDALVKGLKTKLANTSVAEGATREPMESQRSKASTKSTESSSPDDTDEVKEDEAKPGPETAPSSSSYDWRTVYRAACAVLDMVEILCTGCGGLDQGYAASADRNGNAVNVTGALENAAVDMVWASKIVSFTAQMLCSLKRWTELSALGRRFTTLFQSHDELVSAALPLIVLAQREVVSIAESEAGAARQQLEARESQWQEQNKKKKRKRKTHVVVKPTPQQIEAEKAFLAERDELSKILEDCILRLDCCKKLLDDLERQQEELIRDKSSCLEAFEKALVWRKQALLGHLREEEPDLGNLMVQIPGLTTKRSKTQRTGRSQQSVVSKASRASKLKTGRSNRVGSDAMSIMTKRTNKETEVDADAENGIQSPAMRSAISAYEKAIQLMRQKQETTLLARALCELGDLHASQGGAKGWIAARVSWLDGIDAVLKTVGSVDTWEAILESIVMKKPPVGVENCTIRSPELGVNQSLLASFGAMGCVFTALNAYKLARFTCSDQSEQRLQLVRLAGLFFSSLVATGMPHPTRLCEFATYHLEQLFPVLDHGLANAGVSKELVVNALDYVSRALACTSHLAADNLLALPVLCILEWFGFKIACSNSILGAARVVRARALIKIGLLTEASSVLCDVIVGRRLNAVEVFEVVPRSGEIDNSGDLQSLLERHELQQNAPTFNASKLPWTHENARALEFLCNSPNCEPLPFIKEMLGVVSTNELALARAEFVLQVAKVWPLLEPREILSDDSSKNEEEAGVLDCDAMLSKLQQDLLASCAHAVAICSVSGHKAKGLSDHDQPKGESSARSKESNTSSEAVVTETAALNSTRFTGDAAIRGSLQDMKLAAAAIDLHRSRFDDALQLLTETMQEEGDHADVFTFSSLDRTDWWLECRLLGIMALVGAQRSDQAAMVCRQTLAECEVSGDVSVRRRVLLHLGKLQLGRGNRTEALKSVQIGAELTDSYPDQTQVDLELLVSSLRQSGVDHSTEMRCWELMQHELCRVGFFAPARLTCRPTQSLYTPALPAFVFCACRFGVSLLEEGLADRGKQVLLEGLKILRLAAHPLEWLAVRICLSLGRCEEKLSGTSSQVAAAWFASAFKLGMESGAYDHALLREACSGAAQTVQSTAQQVEWLNCVVVLGRLEKALVSNGAALMRTAPSDLGGADGSQGRETALGQSLARRLAANADVTELFFFMMSRREESHVIFDMWHEPCLQGIHKYLCKVVPQYSKLVGPGNDDLMRAASAIDDGIQEVGGGDWGSPQWTIAPQNTAGAGADTEPGIEDNLCGRCWIFSTRGDLVGAFERAEQIDLKVMPVSSRVLKELWADCGALAMEAATRRADEAEPAEDSSSTGANPANASDGEFSVLRRHLVECVGGDEVRANAALGSLRTRDANQMKNLQACFDARAGWCGSDRDLEEFFSRLFGESLGESSFGE
ncbi:Cilia- and flagella-associated protein 54 (Flagella-associated protein 54) [Durusdinium trenchii]|uniref:Cilia- and flagella-associated protein 54 (Flagella-associated protein 54) n=1 Tax=Durusdinium trenchii TaxID=1381693 RepID=A0ABP0SFI9_9DINO